MAISHTAAAMLAAGWRQRIRRAASAYFLRDAESVGPGAVVIGRPYVASAGSLRIGADFHLSSRPAQSHLVVMRGGTVEVGDGVFISYGAAISAQREVRVGDGARFGPFVVVMDSDFHVAGDRGAAAEPAPVRIGKGVVLGSRVTVLRGSDIGDGARVRSGAVVSGQVPAGAVVGGVPARAVNERAASDGEEEVPALVMRVLGLASQPAPSMGPHDIPQWDSLGALKLLLALEEAFAVTLGEEDVAAARSVARLQEIVEVVRQRKAKGADPRPL